MNTTSKSLTDNEIAALLYCRPELLNLLKIIKSFPEDRQSKVINAAIEQIKKGEYQ